MCLQNRPYISQFTVDRKLEVPLVWYLIDLIPSIRRGKFSAVEFSGIHTDLKSNPASHRVPPQVSKEIKSAREGTGMQRKGETEALDVTVQ